MIYIPLLPHDFPWPGDQVCFPLLSPRLDPTVVAALGLAPWSPSRLDGCWKIKKNMEGICFGMIIHFFWCFFWVIYFLEFVIPKKVITRKILMITEGFRINVIDNIDMNLQDGLLKKNKFPTWELDGIWVLSFGAFLWVAYGKSPWLWRLPNDEKWWSTGRKPDGMSWTWTMNPDHKWL